MVTIQTFVVYILLFLLMLLLAKISSDRKEWSWMCIAILMYSLIFGMRYGVGFDHLFYVEDYQSLLNGLNNPFDDTEFGFKFIRDFFAKRGFHYAIFFSLIAFIQLWLIFKAVKRDTFIYPFLVIAFFLGCIWLTYSNGLRQQLAFCIFAYSLLFVENIKKLPIHYLLLFLAYSMHHSAALLIVITALLMIKKDWFSNIKLQTIFLIVAIIVGKLPIVETFLFSFEGNLGLLESFMEESGYNGYFEYDGGERMFNKGGAAGVGYYIALTTNLIIVWFSNKVKQLHGNKKFVTHIYNLAYIGMLLYYLFINSAMVGRINYYFYGFVYIFGAYTLHYLYNNNKKMFIVLLATYILTFIGVTFRMYDNTAAFYFFWQNELYGI